MASSETSDQSKKGGDSSLPESSSSEESEGNFSDKLECAVCLQTCIQPVRLPCSHIFCYLCVKGVIHQSKKCAMCRQPIPSNYLDNPNLISAEHPTLAFEGSYQWFYEGKNGWWQYDERTSTEIEAAFKSGDKQCEVLIAGFLYVIDFENNVQMRRNDPIRRRKIKRDLISIPKKGVAGIRLPSQPDSSEDLPNVQNLDLSQDDNSCCSQAKAASSGSEGSSSGPGPSTANLPVKGKKKGRAKQNKASVSLASPCIAVAQPITVNVSSCSKAVPSTMNVVPPVLLSTVKVAQPAAAVNVSCAPVAPPSAVKVEQPATTKDVPCTTLPNVIIPNAAPLVVLSTSDSLTSLTLPSPGYQVTVGRSIIVRPTQDLPHTVVTIMPGTSAVSVVTRSQSALQTAGPACQCVNKRSSNAPGHDTNKKSKTSSN